MEVEKVRAIFSKGNVVTGNGGYMVYYLYKDRGFSQAIADNEKEWFLSLFKSCDKFGLEYIPGEYIRLLFYDGNDESVTFYKPISPESSLNDYDLSQISENHVIFDYFVDVDLYDDDAVREALYSYVNDMIENSEERSNIVSMSDTRRCKMIFDYAKQIARVFACEWEIYDDLNGMPASIDLGFPEGINKIMWFSGNIKDVFLKAVELSTCISIDGDVSHGYLNICFYR